MTAPVSTLADDLIASVPVVNQVVPDGTVSTVSAPIAGAADSLTAEVVQVVVAPVTEAVPVLEPVVEPVTDLVTGVDPLPVELPELPAVVNELPAPAADAPAGAVPQPAGADSRVADSNSLAGDSTSDASLVDTALQPAGQGASLLAATASGQSVATETAVEEPLPLDPSPAPAQAPPAPGSGTGSGGSSAGPSGAAAWLDSFGYHFRVAGAMPGLEDPEHAPAPVSFDPGSSTD